ncbi:MAG: hypothetical protein JOZ48_07140 [Acidobacteriaceae bacterium]|nr:hypothetical protein [Acidobacteriaceae bacterium]
MRNHLPRTSVGTVLLWFLSLLWYGMYAGLAVGIAILLPQLPVDALRKWLPIGFLAIFLFWQIIPLFTLSTGWSLQLNKLQIYPVSNSALFGIEVLLRLTTAPEMILVLGGAIVGLERRPDTSWLSAIFVFLYIPLNLFLSLAIREFILHSFERNRFRELFAILLISIGVLPQLFLRTSLGQRSKPFFLALSQNAAAPWHEVAQLSSSAFSGADLILLLTWIGAVYVLARRQFDKALVQDEAFRNTSTIPRTSPEENRKFRATREVLSLPTRLFRDPLAALLEKEFQSLVRMPRFRVIFGMACFFSIIVFLPISLRSPGGLAFVSDNFLPLVTLYGLLLLSDVLLLNIFGFDRQAAQIYFVTPVAFKTVLRAKNITALAFIFLQAITVLIIAAVMRLGITLLNVANALAASAVVSVFFLSAGNLISISMPRAIDAKQTFRKQAGGKMQLWFALCSVGMLVLMGFAFLARWALQSNWALLGVLLVEFLVGVIVYHVASESAVERGMRDRERILETLSRGSAPIGLGL